MTSYSFISLLYAITMTYLLPLLFKAYISSTNLFLIEKSIPENRLNLMKYYPYCNGSSFLIFLSISKFADKRVIAKVPSLNAITPLSLSICIFLFKLCCEVFYTLILLKHVILLQYFISTIARSPCCVAFFTKLLLCSSSL